MPGVPTRGWRMTGENQISHPSAVPWAVLGHQRHRQVGWGSPSPAALWRTESSLPFLTNIFHQEISAEFIFIYSCLGQTNPFKRKVLWRLLFSGGAFWWPGACYNCCSCCRTSSFGASCEESRMLLLIRLMTFQGREKQEILRWPGAANPPSRACFRITVEAGKAPLYRSQHGWYLGCRLQGYATSEAILAGNICMMWTKIWLLLCERLQCNTVVWLWLLSSV